MPKITQAYYRLAEKEEFSEAILHDNIPGISSSAQALDQEGNPIDSWGNELRGVQYYLIVLDGIKHGPGIDLRRRYENDEKIHWRLVIGGNGVWETRTPARSMVEEIDLDRSRARFNIPEMEMFRRDTV